MTRLTIHHTTRYEYERPVSFGPHRLLMRPRDSHAVRILEADLTFSQSGPTRWVYDALGNCVCYWTPDAPSRSLSITSDLVIERFPAPLSPMLLRDPHTATPIVYGHEDRHVLSPFIEPAIEDDGTLLKWLRPHIGGTNEPAIDFLLRFTREIHGDLTYEARDDEGVQAPSLTLQRRSGACRDYAWLMVEALRRMGFAARFVTGYLHSPAGSGVRGAGATHAWCEVFLPDLGWMEFDPTNGLAESRDLIPIAVTRTPERAAPIRGTIEGDPGWRRMIVEVDVRLAQAAPEPAAAA
jgi:transglutaminase-like putative cysteine protease